MSFTTIRPYFNTIMTTVDADLREWTDAFNIENIPESILNKSWHITFNPANQVSLNQTGLRYDYPITLNVFLLGYRVPADAVDTANSMGESIIKECLKHSNRLAIAEANSGRIINVISNQMSINPLAASNDNVVRLQLDFTCQIIYEIS